MKSGVTVSVALITFAWLSGAPVLVHACPDAEYEKHLAALRALSWAFLFGAEHPSNVPLSASVQSNVCEASTRSCDLSKQVYARAVSEEHNH